MRHYNLTKQLYFENGITLCLGMFDGMHLGHQRIIEEANKLDKETAILDFGEDFVIKQVKKGCFLSSYSEKELLYQRFNINITIHCSFINDLKDLTPYEFVKDVLKRVNAINVVAGADFRFGKDARGDINDLVRICLEFGINVVVVPLFIVDGTKISSSNIIKLIQKGAIKDANFLLGYNYFITGKVIKGFQNGRKIGFKTANIELKNNQVCPSFGVYWAIVEINEKSYYSMVNIGIHPTIDQLIKPVLEVHIFDFNSDIYGLTINVKFIDFIRKEQKFSSIDELIHQLEIDKSMILCLISHEKHEK